MAWSLLAVFFVYAMISNKINIIIIAFLISLAVTTLISLGVSYGINLYKTGVLDTTTFFMVSGLLFGSAIVYYGILYARYYLPRIYQNTHYVHLPLKIFHFNELPIILTELKFSNAKGRESIINFSNNCWYYTQKEISGASIRNRVKMLTRRPLCNTVQIPLLSDKFCMSYYSIAEDLFYSDEFEFPYQQLELKPRFDLNGKPEGNELEGIFLLIKPQGKIDLCDESNQLLISYTSTTESLTNEKKEQITEDFLSSNRPIMTRQNLLQMVNEINASDRLEKAVETHQMSFHWKISVEGPTKIVDIVMTSLLYIEQSAPYEWLNTLSKKSVPNEIKMNVEFTEEHKPAHIILNIDKEKLYQIVQPMIAENREEPVEFLIIIKDSISDSDQEEFQKFIKSKKGKVPNRDSSMLKDEFEKEQIRFFVKTKKETVAFTDWDTGFPNYDLLKGNWG